jgi:hypothetical protein
MAESPRKTAAAPAEETEVVTDEPTVTDAEAKQRLLKTGDERLQKQLRENVVSPMTLAKVLGIRPQQIYNAIRNGHLTAVKENNTQKLVIEEAEAVGYAARRYGREAAREAKVAAELAGQQK